MNTVPGLEMIISAVIAAGLELSPRAKAWWDKRNGREKQIYILLTVLAISILGLVFNCLRGVQCPTDWYQAILDLIYSFVLSLIATQGAHRGVKYLPKDNIHDRI